MKKQIKRFVLAMLCVTVTASQTACGFISFNTGDNATDRPSIGTGTDSEVETTPSGSSLSSMDGTQPPSAKTPAELARERLKSLPDRDFDGSSIIIATADGTTICPTDSDSTVVRARADAKRAVEEKYNTTILTNVTDSETLLNEARAAYNSDLYYADLLAIPLSSVGAFMSEGLLANLRSLPYIDLDAEYFNSRITAASTAGDAIYAVGGSASFNPEYLTCIYYNRTLAKRCGLGDIYDLVHDGEWTWDRLTEFSQIAAAYRETVTAHGTSLSNADFTDVASFAMGIDYVSNDLGTVPTVDYMSSDRANIFTDIADKIYKHMYGKRTFTNKDAGEAISLFTSGDMLFYTDRLYFMSWIFDVNVDWGILPMPKYDTEQEGYLSLLDSDAPVFCVLANTPSYETSAIILEALNAAAQDYTLDAYKNRCIDYYLRDDGSIHMLDIICEGASTDFAHMYASGFRYMENSTYGAVHKTVTSRTTLNTQYRNYRNTTNYWLSAKIKVYS